MDCSYLRRSKKGKSAPADYGKVETSPIPPGVYLCRILSWWWDSDRKEQDYLYMRYRIERGKYAGKNLSHRYYWTDAAKARSQYLLDSLGVNFEEPYEESSEEFSGESIPPIYVELETVLGLRNKRTFADVVSVRRLDSLDDTPDEQPLTGTDSALSESVVSDTLYSVGGSLVDSSAKCALTEWDSDVM